MTLWWSALHEQRAGGGEVAEDRFLGHLRPARREAVDDGLVLLQDLLPAGRAALQRNDTEEHVLGPQVVVQPAEHRVAGRLDQESVELAVQLDELLRVTLVDNRPLLLQYGGHRLDRG